MVGYTKIDREGQICTIGTGLVPTLDCGGDGIQEDGEIKSFWMLPPVGDFFTEGDAFIFFQLWNVFEIVGRLSDQGAFAEKGESVFQSIVLGKGFDILQELIARNADQRISNSEQKDK